MINRRTNNISIMKDTLGWIKNNQVLKETVEYSLKNQKLYLENDEVNISENPNKECEVVVSKKRSFEAASIYSKKGKKVCVLNFASSVTPGGGVMYGASAQEECLCRCSTLYPCLDIDEFWKQFYMPHYKMDNPLYNDDCIYTPEVSVIKTDESSPERMDEKDWYKVDVLTCAAPNLRETKITEQELYNLHVSRIERIFKIAIKQKAEVIILGAFGCGAFSNPPEIVSKAFKDVQDKYKNYFDTIEYAVYCSKYDEANYEVFGKTFADN